MSQRDRARQVAEPTVWRAGDATRTPAQTAQKLVLEKLVKKAARGDHTALNALCTRISRNVLTNARLIAGSDAAAAEDIAQEVLIKVCKSIGKLRDAKAFHIWLASIVSSEAHSYWRKNGKHGNVLHLDEYTAELPEENEERLPQEYTLRAEEARLIKEMIDALPMRQREAMVFYYYRDLSMVETAGVMGVTQQSVSQYLKLARDKLKRQLDALDSKAGVSLAVIPVGILAKNAFAQAAGQIHPGQGWAVQVVQLAMQSTHRVAATAKPAFAVKLLSGLAVVPVAAGVTAAVLAFSHGTPAAAVQGDISFTNASVQQTNTNPARATVKVWDDGGELAALHWEIHRHGDTAVLCSGDGSAVDDTLAGLLDAQQDGHYVLEFYMEGARGASGGGWISREFWIKT